MRTSIGDYLRKLREANNETLRKMAENLNISSAFLSAIENGKKKMPDNICEQLISHYNLTKEEQDALKYAALESAGAIKIDLNSMNPEERKLALTFARKFKTLSESESSEILRILNDKVR